LQIERAPSVTMRENVVIMVTQRGKRGSPWEKKIEGWVTSRGGVLAKG